MFGGRSGSRHTGFCHTGFCHTGFCHTGFCHTGFWGLSQLSPGTGGSSVLRSR
jgi:hypothetical protein